MKVGVIGLGHMGAGMAASLLRAGHEVTVYNRTPAKAEALVAKGAKLAASVADACRGEAVMTMLANDEAVDEVVFGDSGVLANLPPGALHISSSTISVDLADRLAAAHAAHGSRFVSAPVFGRPDVAAAGKLLVIAAGAWEAIDDAALLLIAIGCKTTIVSETPSKANLVKLLLLASVESLGERMALVARTGVDCWRYLDILTSTLFDAAAYKIRGGMIADCKFEPAAITGPFGQRDLQLAVAAADDLGLAAPLAALLRDRFLALAAQGSGQLAWPPGAWLTVAVAGQPGPWAWGEQGPDPHSPGRLQQRSGLAGSRGAAEAMGPRPLRTS